MNSRSHSRRASVAALALGIAGAVAIGSASADPPPKVYKACPRDKVWSDAANGCICAEGRSWDDTSKTCALEDAGAAKTLPPPPTPTTKKDPEPPRCPQGKTRSDAGACVDIKKPAADAGPMPDGGCGPNREWKDAFGGCVPACGRGEVLDFYGRACHPIKVR